VLVTSRLDKPLREDLFNWRNSDPSEHMRRYGDVSQIAGPVIGTGFLLHGLAADNRKSKDTALLAYESFVVSGLACSAIKFVVGRKRPEMSADADHFDPGGHDSSFPSGHTTVAFAAATVFSEQCPHWYVAAPAYTAASAVGFSRMYANKHWMSDVVAGAFLGTAVSHALRARLYRRRREENAWQIVPRVDGVRFVRSFGGN